MPGFLEILQFLRLHSVIVVTIVFTLVLLANYWPGRRDLIQRHAQIPLDDDR